MAITLGELEKRTGAVLEGDTSHVVKQVTDAGDANADSLIYFNNVKDVIETQAGAVVLPKNANTAPNLTSNKLFHDNPRAAFALAATVLHPHKPAFRGLHTNAQIAKNTELANNVSVGANAVIQAGTKIGSGSSIGAGCFVGENVIIAENTRIDHNVIIYSGVKIGSACEVMSGVVIGADGFGFEWYENQWLKVPQLGSVQIGDNVSVGANTTIDCGSIRDTIIENGVVVDNQVQIGHNVRVGEHAVICGCTAIAGSSVIGKRCRLGGRVSIVDHVELGDDVHVQATSVVTRSLLKAGIYSSTLSAQPVSLWHKTLARLKRLESLTQRVTSLEKNN